MRPDLEAEVAAEVARIEQQFTKARLAALTAARGIEAAGDAAPGDGPAQTPTEAP